MGDLECSGACLSGKRLLGDLGTQGDLQEFAPRLLELWAKVPPIVPPDLRQIPIELSPRTILYA